MIFSAPFRTVTGTNFGDDIEGGFGAAFDGFAEVMAAASDNGVNTTIVFGGGDIIVLRNVLLADLDADDFTFV